MPHPARPAPGLWLALCCGLLVGGSGSSSLVHGTTVLAVGADELLRASERIVHVVCESARGARDARGRIVTHYRLRVLDCMKGEATEWLDCTLPGGEVGRQRTVIAGLTPWRPGEEVILFLHGFDQPLQAPVGLDQGSYRVITEPGTGARSVRRASLAGLHLVGEPATPPSGVRESDGPDSETSAALETSWELADGLSLQAFKERVAARLATLPAVPEVGTTPR